MAKDQLNMETLALASLHNTTEVESQNNSHMFEMQAITKPLTNDDHVDTEEKAATPKVSDTEVAESRPKPVTPTAASPLARDITYPGPLLLSVLIIALLLAMFLVALDMASIGSNFWYRSVSALQF